MNKKLKKKLYLIVCSAFLFATAMILPLSREAVLGLFAAAYLITGGEILLKAWRGVCRGQVFDENFLMMIATFGAWALGEYAEAVAVMLFFQVGEFFQTYAVNRSRKSIAALMDIRPDYARVKRGGKWQEVSPEEVKAGEVILVRPGEKIPLDAVVLKGSSSINTAALTGESMPRDAGAGSEIMSGCINLSGVLEVKVISVYAQSTVAKILDLVENAGNKKAKMENFITRFARYYTPAVVLVAAVLAVLPPLLWNGQSFSDWGYRAITFLVISCPCALVISVPLSFFGGIGAASRCGVLIKGGNYLEALGDVRCVVFDKTGTLTKGAFAVKQICSEGMPDEELLKYTAYAENFSSHPIAISIKQAYGGKIDETAVKNVKELSGMGLEAEVDGHKVCAGNLKLMNRLKLKVKPAEAAGTVIYTAVDGKYAGCLVIGDELKKEARDAVASLKQGGNVKTVIVSGDVNKTVAAVAEAAGVDLFFGECLPADKVTQIEVLQSGLKPKEKLLFVGDGINDAPVIARADVGAAMGGVGSDAAVEAADIVIMNDDLSKLAAAIRISRKTLRIAKENVVFALGVKFLVLGLGAAGYASIWAAVFADVGVSVIAILNAVRALRFK